jgi:muramoyltetrapeptide carboxypeptidase
MTTSLINLKAGDCIDIIAPSARCDDTVIPKVQTLIESWGLKANIPSDIFGEDLLSANSTEKRFEHLVNAMNNPNSKVIWCLLGGYGSAKLVPHLMQLKPIKQNKLFIGFSDITVLHLFLQQQWGWSTIHGPTARQTALNGISAESIASIKSLIFGSSECDILNRATPLNQQAEKQPTIEGVITGGNLTLMQTSIGTPWQINAENKIVLIEEVKERGYRIDRSLLHLMQAGVFDKAKGILLGDVTESDEPDGTSLIDPILKNFSASCSIPVYKVNGVGHGSENFPIILGKAMTIRTQ